MKYLLIILITLANLSMAVEISAMSQIAYDKIINGNYGYEVTFLRGTIKLDNEWDLKFGISQTYTGMRGSSMFTPNHDGFRADMGFNWTVPFTGLKAGYTHSERSRYAGANPTDVYNQVPIDRLYIRSEYDLKLFEE